MRGFSSVFFYTCVMRASTRHIHSFFLKVRIGVWPNAPIIARGYIFAVFKGERPPMIIVGSGTAVNAPVVGW